MTNSPLHGFVTLNREEIIRRCRAKVAGRSMPAPTEAEITHGVPVFLDRMLDALRLGLGSSLESEKSAVTHRREGLLQGITVSQVVQDYGDVCQTVTSLAWEMNAAISTDDFRALNLCLDEAIAGALIDYGSERNRSALGSESTRANERLGYLAHQGRNLTDIALQAFDVLRTGSVGVAGTTASVLQRTLVSMRALMERSLTDVRLPQAARNRQQFMVSEFIDELAAAAVLEAKQKDLTLDVLPVESDVMVEADRGVLSAVVVDLLNNAFKFTNPHTTVTLRVGASVERVLIEILDECGGLLDGNCEFHRFEELPADGATGLGLAFSRWGVEANDGKIYARNLPGKGCVFTVDLPRLGAPAVMLSSF